MRLETYADCGNKDERETIWGEEGGAAGGEGSRESKEAE